MSGFAAIVFVIVAALNPPLVAERSRSAELGRWLGYALGIGAALAVAAATAPILEALDVSIPTFRTAAGAVVALTGARWLVGPGPQPDGGDVLVLGVVDAVTPGLVLAVMATTAVDGWPATVGGAAVASAASMALAAGRLPPPVVRGLRRLVAGLAVAAGVALIYAGIRAV